MATNGQMETRPWDSSDELRTNLNLKVSEFAQPVLGLIFLHFADHKLNCRYFGQITRKFFKR